MLSVMIFRNIADRVCFETSILTSAGPGSGCNRIFPLQYITSLLSSFHVGHVDNTEA